MAFGEDPFSQLYGNEFEFKFYNFSRETYTYYTMAIYSNNWGLTEQKKSEYQIKVEADVVGLCDVVDCEEEEDKEDEEPESDTTVGASEPFVLRKVIQ
jgi:hypothetical protein